VSGARSNFRMARILREMKNIVRAASATYDCFVSESDATFWKVLMAGPEGSPYEGACNTWYLHDTVANFAKRWYIPIVLARR